MYLKSETKKLALHNYGETEFSSWIFFLVLEEVTRMLGLLIVILMIFHLGIGSRFDPLNSCCMMYFTFYVHLIFFVMALDQFKIFTAICKVQKFQNVSLELLTNL